MKRGVSMVGDPIDESNKRQKIHHSEADAAVQEVDDDDRSPKLPVDGQ